jgi:RNA polymerase sigma-70 factor (ECF subfamily)
MEKTGLKHTDDESDKNLAKLSSEGSEEASRELVKRYSIRIKNHISMLVADPDDTDDISQEVFAKAFQMINSYNTDFAFSTWIYTIARNSSIDFLRRKRLNTRSLDSFDGSDEGSGGEQLVPSPEDHLIYEQEIEKIHKAINSLPDSYRVVAEMRFIHEYAYEEISKELSLPLGTVKTRIRRAKERLQKDGKLNIQLLP